MATELKKQTKKGLYWKFADQFSNYGMQFVVGIFMARMLSPDDYGITALPAVFMMVGGIFASAGFGQAMVRKPELTEQDLATAFYYSVGVGALIYILLFIASPWIAAFYHVPVLTPLIRVTALSFIYGPIGAPQQIILQRRLDFKTPTTIAVVTRIISGVVGIYMAYNGYGVWALTISALVSGLSGQLIVMYFVRWYPKTGWSKESFQYLWGFGNKYMASQVIDTLYNNLTPIIIGKFFSTADLGMYNRAQGYARMPSQNVHGVISSVTYPVLAKIQDDDDRLGHAYIKMLKVTAYIVFPMMVGLAALAKPLIVVMITAKWLPCVIMLQLLCFSMMWWPIHAINLNLLLIKGRSDLFLRLEIIKKVWGLAIMAVSLPFGVVAFCAAGIVSSLVSLVINTYYTGKFINCGFWEQIRFLTPTLCLSACVFVGCYLLTMFCPSYVLQIVIGIPMGMIIYIVGSFLFKFEELHELKYLLSKK